MSKIHKIIFLFFTLFFSDSFAQEQTIKSLADSLVTAKPSESNPQKANDSKLLINEAKEGLASILLGNKIGSLMLDEQELSNVERAAESFKNNVSFSLDGTDEKSKTLSEEDKLKQEEDKSQENEKSYIYLASIIYFSPKDWIVWINDKKITSQSNDRKKELYVEAIKRDSVKVLWKLSLSKWKVISGLKEELAPKTNGENQIEIRFSLKQNQTFVLSTNTVVEGQALNALLKKKEDEKKDEQKDEKKVVQPTTIIKP